MKKTYFVTGRVDGRITYEVEAESVAEAIKKGQEMMEGDVSLDGDYNTTSDIVQLYVNAVEDEDGNILWDKA